MRSRWVLFVPLAIMGLLFGAFIYRLTVPAEKLIESQPAAGVQIVGLGEHVDYWDRLGWKDRFSSAALTARQQKYANRSKGADIYTPQMVVDGQDAFVGSDLTAARRAIERAVAGQLDPGQHIPRPRGRLDVHGATLGPQLAR